MTRKLKTFLALSFQDKLLLVEALFMLAFFRVVVIFIPLRKVALRLGKFNGHSEHTLTLEQQTKAMQIRRTIFGVSSNVFWKSVCMDQALTAMTMLNRRNIPNTLYLGTKINHERKKLDAHAWVICNNKIFIGGPQSNSFKVVASFSR